MSFDPSTTNPYAASTPPTAPKKSNVLLYVLGGIGALFLILCIGCIATVIYGGGAAMNLVGEQLKPSLSADPVVQQHIGDIKTLSMDFGASTMETQRSQEKGGPQRMVFTVEGSKGKGTITGTPLQGQNRLTNAELKMSTGETFPLSQ
jgi:hypothetical protein